MPTRLTRRSFAQQAEAVCDLYERAGQLAEQGIHVVSTDEKTGIQALERMHPGHPDGAGAGAEAGSTSTSGTGRCA